MDGSWRIFNSRNYLLLTEEYNKSANVITAGAWASGH